MRRRRERIGWDKKRLASEAGVSRETLAAIENGKGFQRLSLVKLERALEEAEAEMGLHPIDPAGGEGGEVEEKLIEFRVEPDGTLIVKGPVADREELMEAVERLMRRTRTSAQEEPPATEE